MLPANRIWEQKGICCDRDEVRGFLALISDAGQEREKKKKIYIYIYIYIHSIYIYMYLHIYML